MKRGALGLLFVGGVAGQLTTSVNTLMPATTVSFSLDRVPEILDY